LRGRSHNIEHLDLIKSFFDITPIAQGVSRILRGRLYGTLAKLIFLSTYEMTLRDIEMFS